VTLKICRISVEALFEMKFLFHNGHQDIDADRDLRFVFHRVVAGAVKGFDAQVCLIQRRTTRFANACVERGMVERKLEVVGQEDKVRSLGAS